MSSITQMVFASENFWLLWGFAAQGMFAMRFVVQLIASEIRKTSYLPKCFWYFSIAGSCGLIVYAAARQDPVFLVGQTLALGIYIRNIVIMSKGQAGNVTD